MHRFHAVQPWSGHTTTEQRLRGARYQVRLLDEGYEAEFTLIGQLHPGAVSNDRQYTGSVGGNCHTHTLHTSTICIHLLTPLAALTHLNLTSYYTYSPQPARPCLPLPGWLVEQRS